MVTFMKNKLFYNEPDTDSALLSQWVRTASSLEVNAQHCH